MARWESPGTWAADVPGCCPRCGGQRPEGCGHRWHDGVPHAFSPSRLADGSPVLTCRRCGQWHDAPAHTEDYRERTR